LPFFIVSLNTKRLLIKKITVFAMLVALFSATAFPPTTAEAQKGGRAF
jgi:hypothetical protein